MDADVLNIAPATVWAVAISQLLTMGLAIWNLMASGSRANAKKIEEQTGRMDQHEARISRVEQSIGGLPAQADIHSVQLSLSEMRGDLREMRASMTGNNAIMLRLETIVTRHEDHLLAGKAR